MSAMNETSINLGEARVMLIANGKSGKKDARERLALIHERLAPLVGELVIRRVAKGRDIAGTAELAVATGFDVVLALGGDGTQSAVAGALAGSDVVMGVLPGGTFNYFARELGTESLEDALDAVAGGHILRRDLGQINKRIFINNASFGLYPRILMRREDIYRRWGRSRLAAYWSVLVAVRELDDPMHLTVTMDGQQMEFDTPLAFVARSAYQLDSLGLDGAQAVRDGHFALFISRGSSRMALMKAAVRLAMGRSVRGEDFELVISDDMLIESRARRKLVALDGEKEKMTAPFRLRVLPGALRVFAPAQGGARPAA